MIEKPQVAELPAQAVAVLHLTVPRTEIQKVMGPGRAELLAAVAAQGLAPAGPWFTHHLKMDPTFFDFEIGVPVSGVLSAAGRVHASQWPAMKAARTVFHGGYEGLGAAWGEFEAWIAAQGLKSAADLWECYVTGPESSPQPSDWRTQLNRPLLA